jgi:hypothetical protein
VFGNELRSTMVVQMNDRFTVRTGLVIKAKLIRKLEQDGIMEVYNKFVKDTYYQIST